MGYICTYNFVSSINNYIWVNKKDIMFNLKKKFILYNMVLSFKLYKLIFVFTIKLRALI